MPKVSVVILNWNGKKFLKKCLYSLERVKYLSLEIIVVDNNSSDGSSDFIKKNYPQIKFIQNRKNYGFAKGNNIGCKASTGEYVLFLNNDTIVTSDFLNILIEKLKKNPKIGCIQPQIRTLHNKKLLDEAGAYLTFTGFLYHFGFLKNYKQKIYQKEKEIFSAKGACILIPRQVLKKVGLFDEDFFIFFEETDLCFRIWLAGYKVIYEPKAVIYHMVAGDTAQKFNDERRIFLTFKNMICSYLKNFSKRNLLTIFPVFLLLNFTLFSFYIFTFKFNLAKALLRAYYWNIINFKKTWQKRYFIQKKIRKKEDREVNADIIRNPRLSYYYYLFTNTEKYEDD